MKKILVTMEIVVEESLGSCQLSRSYLAAMQNPILKIILSYIGNRTSN